MKSYHILHVFVFIVSLTTTFCSANFWHNWFIKVPKEEVNNVVVEEVSINEPVEDFIVEALPMQQEPVEVIEDLKKASQDEDPMPTELLTPSIQQQDADSLIKVLYKDHYAPATKWVFAPFDCIGQAAEHSASFTKKYTYDPAMRWAGTIAPGFNGRVLGGILLTAIIAKIVMVYRNEPYRIDRLRRACAINIWSIINFISSDCAGAYSSLCNIDLTETNKGLESLLIIVF